MLSCLKLGVWSTSLGRIGRTWRERVEVPAAHEPSLYQHWLASLCRCRLGLARKQHLQLQCGGHAVTTLSVRMSKGVMSSQLDRPAGCRLCRPRPELQAHWPQPILQWPGARWYRDERIPLGVTGALEVWDRDVSGTEHIRVFSNRSRGRLSRLQMPGHPRNRRRHRRKFPKGRGRWRPNAIDSRDWRGMKQTRVREWSVDSWVGPWCWRVQSSSATA